MCAAAPPCIARASPRAHTVKVLFDFEMRFLMLARAHKCRVVYYYTPQCTVLVTARIAQNGSDVGGRGIVGVRAWFVAMPPQGSRIFNHIIRSYKPRAAAAAAAAAAVCVHLRMPHLSLKRAHVMVRR